MILHAVQQKLVIYGREPNASDVGLQQTRFLFHKIPRWPIEYLLNGKLREKNSLF